MLQELIQKLQNQHGLSAEQSTGILSTVTGFIKEKFPMMQGAIDNMFSASTSETAPMAQATAATATAQPTSEVKKEEEHSILDKISDFIPGQAGEKIETFVKGAADKAEGLFDTVKEKAGGFFGK